MANTPSIPAAVLQELQAWSQRRQQFEASHTPGTPVTQAEQDAYNGTTLSPAAHQFATNYANGQPFYNPDTGQVSTAASVWKSPETWAQIGLAGGLVAAPLTAGFGLGGLGGGAGGAAAGGGAGGAGALGGLLGGGGGAYSWLGPAIKGVTDVVDTNKQITATQQASADQLASTKYATDAQAKAAAASLAFQQQQAAYSNTAAETNRQANYDQWAAKQELLGSVGQALGLPARRIPAYVPLPGGGGMPAGGGSAPPGPMPTIDPTGDIAAQAEAYIRSTGATPLSGSGQYWAAKWPELVARGQQLGDPLYAQRRLSQADEITAGGYPAPVPAAAGPGPVGSYL